MSKAYNAGYSQGHLSNEELAELGHTAQSYAEHVEQEYRPDLYKTNFTKDNHEFTWGLLDGANDRAKK